MTANEGPIMELPRMGCHEGYIFQKEKSQSRSLGKFLKNKSDQMYNVELEILIFIIWC